MRDNLNRITIFVVANVAVLFSFSVGMNSEGVTFFTTDPKTVNVMMQEYEKYYSMCEPIMKSYSGSDSVTMITDCMYRFESISANCYQLSKGLSFITIPWDVATSLVPNSQEEKTVFLTSFAQRYKIFNENLKTYTFTDIICLSDIDTIMGGKVVIPAAVVLGGNKQYYTPGSYALHLKSILYKLEHNANYNVVILRNVTSEPVLIYSKEGASTIIGRDEYPFSVFEATEKYIVEAFAEHLRRMIPTDVTPEQNRKNVIARIKNLIGQIEGRK